MNAQVKYNQLTIFDLPSGLRARDEAIARVIENNQCFVATLRGIARILARRRGVVTCDDLREIASQYGIKPETEKAWGGLFKSREWVCAGQIHSKIPTNNGRMIRSWRLRDGAA